MVFSCALCRMSPTTAIGINPAELPFDVLDKYLAPEAQKDPKSVMDHDLNNHCEN